MEKRDTKRKRSRLTVVAEPGSINAYTSDVSRNGMFLVTTKVYAPGTRIRIIVKTKEGPAIGVGIVRWSKRVPPAVIKDIKGGMGVEFTWVSPELDKILEELARLA